MRLCYRQKCLNMYTRVPLQRILKIKAARLENLLVHTKVVSSFIKFHITYFLQIQKRNKDNNGTLVSG